MQQHQYSSIPPAGIQRHIIAGSVGLLLGIQTDRWTRKQAALRDSIYYNYILSHPEDFPPIRKSLVLTLCRNIFTLSLCRGEPAATSCSCNRLDYFINICDWHGFVSHW